MKNIPASPLCWCLALAFAVGANNICAQNSPRKKTSKAPAAAASKRQPPNSTVVPTDSTKPAKTSQPPGQGEAKPSVETVRPEPDPAGGAEQKPPEKPVAESAETPAESLANSGEETSVNPFQSLRDQINDTTIGPERIRLQFRLVRQLEAAGKKPEAIAELRAIVDSEVFDPHSFYNAGNALARMGASDEAIRAYRKAIDQRKGNYSRALNNLGVLLLRTGRWDEAYDSLMSALKVEGFRYAEASYNLGRLYSARGEMDLATREWRRALAVDPEHSAAAMALGGTKSTIVESSGRTETSNNTRNNVVRKSRGAGNAAHPEPSKVLELDPVSYDFLQRARSLSEHGKLSEAVENYKKVIARSGGYLPPANLELSRVLINLKNNDEAVTNLLMITMRDGARYPISYYYLGRLYALKGDFVLAEKAFSQAADAYKSENSSILLEVSRVREQLKDFAGALAALEEYVATMDKQGAKPGWAEESLSVLRQKVKAAQK